MTGVVRLVIVGDTPGGAMHCQHRSAWTFEAELRPWTETW